MGLFNKSKKEDNEKNSNQNSEEPPKLPELPKAPGMESSNKEQQSEPLPKLPSFPNNSTGERFSQNSIKQAVSGEKEGYEDADDFDQESEFRGDDQGQMTQDFPEQEEPEKHYPQAEEPGTRKYEGSTQRSSKSVYQQPPREQSNEPVFVRIDKFENSITSFEKIKEDISEVEYLLKKVTETKQEEDKELKEWEKKMEEIKDKLSEINSNIFSKV